MKQKLSTRLEWLFFAGVFVLCFFYALYKYTYSFNYLQIAEDGHYLALPVTGGLLMLALSISGTLRKNTAYTIIDLMVFVILCYCLSLLALGTTKYNFHNEVFCNTVVFLSFFILFRTIGNDFIFKIIVPIVLIFFLAELYQGYADLFKNMDAGNLSLLVTGHLENSGIYSIYLVLHLPLANYFLANNIKGKKWRIAALIILYTAVGVLVLVTQSRAAIIGAVCYFWKWLFDRENFRQHRRRFVILTVLVFVILICGLIYLKPASAFGRFIIWKISLQHFSEYIWTGTGYGLFPSYYPEWQINYFDALPIAKIGETQSADEVYVAYNESYQLLIELGLAGFVVLGVTFVRLVFKKDRTGDTLSVHMRNTLFILLITSLPSYPLHVNVILILVSICTAYLVPVTFKNIVIPYQIFVRTLLIGILAMVTFKSVNVYRDVKQWYKVQNDVFLSDEQRMATYQALYSKLRGNSRFLLDYGIALYAMQDTFSVKILEESKSLLTTSVTLSTLAQAYESNGSIDKAISTWAALSNFLPYKFTYKDKLLDLYLSRNDLVNTIRIARLIVFLPVKKDDQTVRSIKEKARLILSQNQYPLAE